jgi:hypothetical protein
MPGMKPDVSPDCLIVNQSGDWIYQSSPDVSVANSDFERLAIETFDAFVQTNDICSWNPKREIQVDDPATARFLRSKANQTTREVGPGVFQARAKIWPSNAVLALVAPKLEYLGYVTEVDGDADLTFNMPFLDEICGPSGCARLSGQRGSGPKINLDAFHQEQGVALQVEAGQALENKNYLRNFFEAIVLSTSNEARIRYMGVAVCRQRVNAARSGIEQRQDDFPTIAKRLFALYRALAPRNLQGFFLITY